MSPSRFPSNFPIKYHNSHQKTFRPYENVEHCPHCYNARGPKYVRPRAEKLTDPEILAEYGNGEWPLLAAYEKGEVAENGNYIEREELSVRHGVCGDPEQVTA